MFDSAAGGIFSHNRDQSFNLKDRDYSDSKYAELAQNNLPELMPLKVDPVVWWSRCRIPVVD